jgi:glycosyltransferase involved in cell wall biosynthesis
MRILFLNHNVGWRGGTFFRAYQFARHLAGRGHRVTLMTISQSRRVGCDREVREGVEMIYTPDLLWGVGRTGWDPWDTLVRCLLVRREAWDIVHAWDCRPAVILPAIRAARRGHAAGTRLVLDWCDWWGGGGTQRERRGLAQRAMAPLETWFEEAFRTRADASTVISRALLDRAIKLGVAPETIHLLPQGCDVTGAHISREAARARLGLRDDANVLIGIGTLIKSDAALLFDSLALLFARFPDCRFFLIGNHRAQVPAAIRQSRQFTETGFVSEETLRDYMQACDGLLTPLADTLAGRARWPSKVNPLLAMGRAVILTRVGDLPVLLDEAGAALVARCDPADVVEKAGLLFASPGLREAYEGRARQVARDVLAWPRLTEQLEQIYVTCQT